MLCSFCAVALVLSVVFHSRRATTFQSVKGVRLLDITFLRATGESSARGYPWHEALAWWQSGVRRHMLEAALVTLAFFFVLLFSLIVLRNTSYSSFGACLDQSFFTCVCVCCFFLAQELVGLTIEMENGWANRDGLPLTWWHQRLANLPPPPGAEKGAPAEAIVKAIWFHVSVKSRAVRCRCRTL